MHVLSAMQLSIATYIMYVKYLLFYIHMQLYNFLIAPRLFGPVINGSDVALNNPVVIGCLADGVPPDVFYMSKDGVVINSNYMVENGSVNDTRYSASLQHNIISLEEVDFGVYECIYISPVQTISNSLRLGGNYTLQIQAEVTFSLADTKSRNYYYTHIIYW